MNSDFDNRNQDDEDESFLRRFGPLLGGLVVVSVAMGGIYFFFSAMGGTQAPRPPDIQQISLVQPPPPPPPPPEMEEPPPPEMEEVEIDEPEPEPLADDSAADEPLPGDDLGLDAEGVAGSDGFGLKAKKGGRSLIGGGDRNKWYAGVIQTDLQALLAEIDEIRQGRYAVVVRIWIAEDGQVEDVELVCSTGNQDVDQAIRETLAGGLRLSRSPPEDLPQPIRVRITSRS